MKNLIYSVIIFSLLVNCGRSEDDNAYPTCYKEEIQNILQNPPATPRSNIMKYKYQDKYVYVLTNNGISDEQSVVRDENCNVICYSGGIGGNLPETNTCINWNEAEYISTVWTDPR